MEGLGSTRKRGEAGSFGFGEFFSLERLKKSHQNRWIVDGARKFRFTWFFGSFKASFFCGVDDFYRSVDIFERVGKFAMEPGSIGDRCLSWYWCCHCRHFSQGVFPDTWETPGRLRQFGSIILRALVTPYMPWSLRFTNSGNLPRWMIELGTLLKKWNVVGEFLWESSSSRLDHCVENDVQIKVQWLRDLCFKDACSTSPFLWVLVIPPFVIICSTEEAEDMWAFMSRDFRTLVVCCMWGIILNYPVMLREYILFQPW